jgi:transposase
MPLLSKPLGPQERQAVELRRKGLSTGEIADEMCLTSNHVSTVLTHAKRKGAVFPRVVKKHTPSVPIERLVKIRAELLRAGYRRGIPRIIGERVGLTKNCVGVRLWKYDQAQKRGKAA